MIDKIPPENGEIEIIIEKKPVSVNSKKKVEQKRLIKHIRDLISYTEYFLYGDVKVEIDWFVSQQIRYESVSAHDVDNIISPLIDAISGVEGIIIDDNQIKSISCSWQDLDPSVQEHLIIKIRFIPTEHIEKKGVFFVEFNKGFCFPICDSDPSVIQKLQVKNYEEMLKARYELESRGFPYQKAKLIMPTRRVFHRSRLKGFRIINSEELNNFLNKKI